ncbi:MAG: DUF2207 domain-containing protein [Candidatus Eisenbacteria bacterium]
MTSKTIFSRILLALLAAAITIYGLFSSAAVAKSYRITQVDIDASLMLDGSMDVRELRTYRFSGSFTFAYRDLPADRSVTFDDFEVLEGGRPYRLTGSEEPGTFSISRSGGWIRVTWYYHASDESRTFEFRYRARNAIARYDDAAVLHYKFLSEDWDIPQQNIGLAITPPVPLTSSDVNEWLHGPLWAESEITADGRILARCRHLPPHKYLEVRALYAPDVFPEVRPMAGSVRREIMTEEAEWAEETNRRREAAIRDSAAREKRVEIGRRLAIGIGLAGLLVAWWIFKKYRRKPALPRFLEMSSEIPEKLPPALVGYLLNSRQVTGAALIGTMLNLARRGFLALREEQVEKRSIWGGTKKKPEYHWDLNRTYRDQHSSDLLDHETALIEFIFGDLAEGADSISIDAIKKKRSRFIKFFRDWKKGVEESGKKKEWFDTGSIRGMYYSLAVAGALLALGAASVFVIGLWALVLAGAGIIVLILSFFIPHRTPEGETKARHWKAVKKYLKTYEFGSADRQDLLAQISDYLVYGVVLGLSTRFYEKMAAGIPEGEHGAYFPWYVCHGRSAGSFSPASFGAAFSSMVATTTSAMSTASGTGGGASAGGGGGASSGGGGAG